MWQRELENLGFATIPAVLGLHEIQLFLTGLGKLVLPRTKAGIRHMFNHKSTAAFAQDVRLMAIACDVLRSKRNAVSCDPF